MTYSDRSQNEPAIVNLLLVTCKYKYLLTRRNQIMYQTRVLYRRAYCYWTSKIHDFNSNHPKNLIIRIKSSVNIHKGTMPSLHNNYQRYRTIFLLITIHNRRIICRWFLVAAVTVNVSNVAKNCILISTRNFGRMIERL